MLWPARAIGAATAAYSSALIIKPSVLTKPTGLSTSSDDVTTASRVLSRAVGADVSDALGLGLGLPGRSARKKSAAVAAGWGVLTAITLLLARRD